MRLRSGVVLISEDKIALMKRVKPHITFYVIPGGGVLDGEYTEDAAVREAHEELGLRVKLRRLLAVVERVERGEVSHVQFYYLAEASGGTFGAGRGDEFEVCEADNNFQAVWLPLRDLGKHHIYPSALAAQLEKGLPERVLHLIEPNDYPK